MNKGYVNFTNRYKVKDGEKTKPNEVFLQTVIKRLAYMTCGYMLNNEMRKHDLINSCSQLMELC